MRRILVNMCFLFALAVAAVGTFFNSEGYFLNWDPPTISYQDFKTIVRTNSESIEDILWSNKNHKMVVTLKGKGKYSLFVIPENRKEILDQLLKKEVPLRVLTCGG